MTRVFISSVQKEFAAESEVYLGLYGNEYGYEDEQGVSPTEREYDTAVANGRHRLIFVKRSEQRSPKEAAFVKRVESQVVRKAFTSLGCHISS